MTYLLQPAPIGENKNKNKSKTKKKCTTYKDIINPKVDQQYSTIEGFDDDDEDDNYMETFNSNSLEMQYTNNNQNSENINKENINKETFNNIYDSNQDNHYKSNYGNYDNNYTIDNSEFNKHINYSQETQQDNNNTHINNNKELLTKINYIIHLLEEQRSEKTNYITEELILYLFLGVFIIFVLDTFFKSSKYTR